MNKIKDLLYLIFITIVITLGGFLFGFDSGIINGTVSAIEVAFNSESIATGFNVASMLIGCAIGAFSSGYLSDRFGRKWLMLSMSLLFVLSAWGSGIAGGSAEFIVYRLIGGFAVGVASAVCPAYVCEIAPPKIRGALACTQQLAIVFGLFMAFFSNYAISLYFGGALSEAFWGFQAWQFMFWSEIIPAVIFFVGLLFIPESPRFLVAKGRLSKAEEVLNKISSENAKVLLGEIQESLKGKVPSIKDVFIKNSFKLKPIVVIGIILSIFQQITGINIIFYYGEVLWKSVGFDEGRALEQNVIIGFINVLSTIVAMLLIEKLGRKTLLIIGAFIMFLTLAAMAYFFSFMEMKDNAMVLSADYGRYSFICAIIYVFTFSATWGSIVWVLLGEMFPNAMRSSAVAISASILWLANFSVTMTFPVLLNSIGLSFTYTIYAGSALLSLIFVCKFVSETKGITLENM